MKKLYISFLFAILRIAVCAQPSIQWQKCLGGTNQDVATSTKQTTDGGYIITGYSYSNNGDVSGNHGNWDIWLVKLDGLGNIQWQKCLGGTGDDFGRSVDQIADGGYIVTGYTDSNDGDVSGNHGGFSLGDVWVVKLDSVGNIQWQRCLGGTNDDAAYSIKQTIDGGYILGGCTSSNNGDVSGIHGNRDIWVVKLDDLGNIQWQKCLGGTLVENSYSIQQTVDSGYILVGETFSNNGNVIGNHGGVNNPNDIWVVKLDGLGNIQWQRCLGGTSNDNGYSIQQTFDGGYILIGQTQSNNGDVSGNHGSFDVWVVKLDNLGNIQWQKCFGGTGPDGGFFINLTIDGGFILTGATDSNDGDVNGNHGNRDIWVVKLDNLGNIQWQKCLGGTLDENSPSIQQTMDGGYIIKGGTYSNDGDVSGNHGTSGITVDVWVVKLFATVGLNEIFQADLISVFPNPTTGILNIESNEAIKQIEVFDMLGKLVLTIGYEKQIDLSNLNSGLYLIRFTSENGVEQRRVEVSR